MKAVQLLNTSVDLKAILVACMGIEVYLANPRKCRTPVHLPGYGIGVTVGMATTKDARMTVAPKAFI